MSDMRPASHEGRVLLLAPTSKDAAAAHALFASAGFDWVICKDRLEVCLEIGKGAGAAIVPEEAILNDGDGCLANVLAQQPAWSDFPLIVLTAKSEQSARKATALELTRRVTLVHRPIEMRTLVSTIRTALRDRHRQYATRDYLLERERQSDALRASEERLSFALHSGGLGFWELDIRSGAIQCTPICKATFGLPAEAAVSRELWLRPVFPEDRDRVIRALGRSIDDNIDYDMEYRHVWPDSTVHWVLVRGRAVYDPNGTPLSMVGITLDITDRKQAEAERERLLAEAQRAKLEAEAANRMKDDFLATLSHELRTPLNAILGWAKVLRMAPLDVAEMEEGLAAIERNSVAQAQIIEDLLDISRIVSGNFRLEVQRVNLPEVIEAALDAVSPAASARNIRVHKVLDSIAGPVSGDAARLQQIVWNLLSNAVKFTPKGGNVHVLLERVNSHVEISVIDNGMGIKPEFLPHVFDRFRQADSSTTRRHGGLGLGLAIVRQLVEIHGGSVRAKSAGEGQGATFTVTLPIMVVHPEQSDKPQPKHDSTSEFDCTQGDLTGVRVLVVDDEPDARKLLERVLSDCGAEVAAASSAPEALKLVESFNPHVLVSDIGMPDQDGYDLLRKIRTKGKTPADLPAAALTAFARSSDRKRAMMAGFQTHVAKPVDPAELLAVVASLAGRTGSTK
jgi:PAS domain S-box-containing protein